MDRSQRRRSQVNRFRPQAEPVEARLLLTLGGVATGALGPQRVPEQPGRGPGGPAEHPGPPVRRARSPRRPSSTPRVHIVHGEHTVVGTQTYVAPFATLDATTGFIKIGSKSDVLDNATIVSNPNNLTAVPDERPDRRPGLGRRRRDGPRPERHRRLRHGGEADGDRPQRGDRRRDDQARRDRRRRWRGSGRGSRSPPGCTSCPGRTSPPTPRRPTRRSAWSRRSRPPSRPPWPRTSPATPRWRPGTPTCTRATRTPGRTSAPPLRGDQQRQPLGGRGRQPRAGQRDRDGADRDRLRADRGDARLAVVHRPVQAGGHGQPVQLPGPGHRRRPVRRRGPTWSRSTSATATRSAATRGSRSPSPPPRSPAGDVTITSPGGGITTTTTTTTTFGVTKTTTTTTADRLDQDRQELRGRRPRRDPRRHGRRATPSATTSRSAPARWSRNSSIGTGVTVGARAYVSGSTLAAGRSVPAGEIIINGKDLGQVQF